LPLAAVVASAQVVKQRFGMFGEVVPLLVMALLNLAFNFRGMFAVAAGTALLCILKGLLDAWRARVSPVAFAVIHWGL
jgi:hypothetical protein